MNEHIKIFNTTAEFAALGNAVNTAWTADYQSTGVAGLICTAKDGSGAQLFFPAAGYCDDSSVYGVGEISSYWSSSVLVSGLGNTASAYELEIVNGNIYWSAYTERYNGFNIRPVTD